MSIGLQKLICLRLKGQPGDDLIEGTLLGWREAIGNHWNRETDAPRFREAFRTLMRTQSSWPAPADFLVALPPLPGTKRSSDVHPKLVDEASQRRGLQRCKEILEQLGGPVEFKPPETRQ